MLYIPKNGVLHFWNISYKYSLFCNLHDALSGNTFDTYWAMNMFKTFVFTIHQNLYPILVFNERKVVHAIIMQQNMA